MICDLDGLLADTERLHIRAYQETLAEYGVVLEARDYAQLWIRRGLGIADYVKERDLALDPDEARTKKAARYRELVQSIAEPMPGAIAFLERMGRAKRLALASSSKSGDVAAVIKRLQIGAYFETVVSHAGSIRTKPYPDLFLRAAGLLGVEPAHCVVVEDAQKGAEAAAAAGMKCLVVPNEYTRDDDFSMASLVLERLDEITIELVDSLA